MISGFPRDGVRSSRFTGLTTNGSFRRASSSWRRGEAEARTSSGKRREIHALPYDRLSVATHSMWYVCGNMSIGVTSFSS